MAQSGALHQSGGTTASKLLGTPDRSGTGGEPGRSLRFIGLPSGDYYLIAVDDIEYKATVDTAVLEKLARNATRVTIPERDLIEVSLRRYLLNDVIKLKRRRVRRGCCLTEQ